MSRQVSILLSLFVATGLWSVTVYAQDKFTGSYTGSYTLPAGMSFRVRVAITSNDNGALKGSAELLDGPCRGSYPMQGRYEGATLQLKSTAKGGRAGDCDFGFNVKLEGSKFIGTLDNGWPIELSK